MTTSWSGLSKVVIFLCRRGPLEQGQSDLRRVQPQRLAAREAEQPQALLHLQGLDREGQAVDEEAFQEPGGHVIVPSLSTGPSSIICHHNHLQGLTQSNQ